MIALAEGRDAERDSSATSAPPTAASNAASAFQRDAEAILRRHPIVGPKIAGIEWRGPVDGVVSFRGFPMDAMPPVMRNKFKSRVNQELAQLAKRDGIDATVKIELVDADSKKVMDTLDGKEWVGAFDETDNQ